MKVKSPKDSNDWHGFECLGIGVIWTFSSYICSLGWDDKVTCCPLTLDQDSCVLQPQSYPSAYLRSFIFPYLNKQGRSQWKSTR